MKTYTYTVAYITVDADGYAIATLLPSNGIVTDNPYWSDKDGSHYVAGLSDKVVGDSITL